MEAMKRFLLVVVGICVALLVSSCGGTTTTGSSTSGSSSQSTSNQPAKYGQTTPTAATTTSSAAVKVATLTVSGKSMSVLTDSKGMTLYYFKPDTSQKTACTDSCAQTWPPLVFSGTGKVAAETKLPGELEVYKNANGNQVIYNDHPLYTFSGDTAAGQTNGQGIGGQWFVATPDLAKNK